MIELELLGANGDQIVMTDQHGERYCLVVDDAVRAAVRRARPAALSPQPPAPTPGTQLRPRDLQALMRAGASAAEVAQSTGLDVAHIQRFEGPVLAERAWAVEQARACRIGWGDDSPILGELVIDRLATRGVEPQTLSWDALREGRDPWHIILSFAQGAEDKHARWELDLSAHRVSAVNDEARWLTEAATRSGQVFDQDSSARRVCARTAPASTSDLLDDPLGLPADTCAVDTAPLDSSASSQASPFASTEDGQAPLAESSTEALLADLASHRGRRLDVLPPLLDDDGAADLSAFLTSPTGQARVVSMSDRRRSQSGHHPAGTKLHTAINDDDALVNSGDSTESAQGSDAVPPISSQPALPQMPDEPAPKPKRRSRRSVPSWDEIVFGAKPE